MVTRCPRPRAWKRGRTSFMPLMTPWTLMSTWRRVLSSVSSRKGPRGMIPALLTKTSMGPRRSSTCSTNSWTESRLVTSSGRAIAASPSVPAADCASARSTSPMATCIPSATSACAVARPMPRAAPVIAATPPTSERDCLAMAGMLHTVRYGGATPPRAGGLPDRLPGTGELQGHLRGRGGGRRPRGPPDPPARDGIRHGADVHAPDRRRRLPADGARAGQAGPPRDLRGEPLPRRRLRADHGEGRHRPRAGDPRRQEALRLRARRARRVERRRLAVVVLPAAGGTALRGGDARRRPAEPHGGRPSRGRRDPPARRPPAPPPRADR